MPGGAKIVARYNTSMSSFGGMHAAYGYVAWSLLLPPTRPGPHDLIVVRQPGGAIKKFHAKNHGAPWIVRVDIAGRPRVRIVYERCGSRPPCRWVSMDPQTGRLSEPAWAKLLYRRENTAAEDDTVVWGTTKGKNDRCALTRLRVNGTTVGAIPSLPGCTRMSGLGMRNGRLIATYARYREDDPVAGESIVGVAVLNLRAPEPAWAILVEAPQRVRGGRSEYLLGGTLTNDTYSILHGVNDRDRDLGRVVERWDLNAIDAAPPASGTAVPSTVLPLAPSLVAGISNIKSDGKFLYGERELRRRRPRGQTGSVGEILRLPVDGR